MRVADPVNSAAWTGDKTRARRVSEEAELPILLADDSLNPDAARAVVFGQEESCEMLHGLTCRALADGSTERRIFALNGRYGQGKTSVLKRLRQRLETAGPDERPLTVGEFKVEAAKPDDLAYAFERQVAIWTLGRRLVVLAVVAGLLFAIGLGLRIETPGGAAKNLGWWAWFASGASLSAMVAVFLFAVQWDVPVGRRLQALFVTLNRRGISELWRAVLVGKPDVLIVDNVDRAVVEQQRAFFYALRRHRELLPRVVIVAFDETALSMADPNPDAPQELLAKVFSTCIRLYPMTRDDAVNLVEHVLKELGGCGGNDARWPLRFLRQYAAAGDLARIFLLHRRHSVRFCKQFVNTLGVSAAMLKINDSADFSALMRLLGLFEFLPWLRHDPKALEDMLNDEDVDALLRFAASLVGREKLVADLDAGVRTYMRLTRHMLPAFADWSEFVARFGSPEKSDQSAATTAPKAASAGPALLCLPERSKGEEMAEPDRAWLRCWLELDTLHAEETDAARRRDALRRKSKEVLAKTWPSNPPPTYAQQQLGWIYLIQRLWLADGGLAGELQNEDWLPGQYFLAETGHWWDEYARNTEPDSCFAPMLQDGGLRDAFIRLNLASPPGPLSLMRGCLAIAFLTNRRAGQTRAIPRFLRRMVSINEDNNWPLVLPALLSHRFDLDNDIAFLSEKLPGLPRGRDLDTPQGWAMAKRLVEFRGRMHRGGFEGALAPVRDWVRHVRMLRGSDPTAMGHLLQVAVSGLPRFGGSMDGAWLESAVLDCAGVLAGRHEVSEVKALEHALRSVADVDVPNLMLFAVSQGNADAAAILARQCAPPTSWPVSYLRCMDALASSPADPRRSVLDASAAQVLLSGALSRYRTSMRRFLACDQGLMTTSLLSLIRPHNA